MSARVEVEIEIQSLKIKIRGDRDEAPRIAQRITEQMRGLVAPAASIAADGPAATPLPPVDVEAKPPSASRSRARKAQRVAPASDTGASSPKWQHDPDKWGNPKQSWNPTKKALWLLYVVANETAIKEMTAGQIAEVFNAHFREAGTIRGSNVSRDLGRAKQASPPLVGQATAGDANGYFLTEAGKKFAEAAVADARGLDTAAAELYEK